MAGSHQPGGKRRFAGGFTLIEVLIAVVVLSMGIVLVLQGLHGVLGVWDGAVERLRSVMLVREKLEEARIAAVQGGGAPENAAGRFGPPFSRYRWKTEVEPARMPPRGTGSAGADAGGRLYGVRCTVWREDGNRDFGASTLIYIPPPDEGAPP